MKRTRISEWPSVHVNVNPRTLEALEDEAEERGLSVSALVREALDRSVRPAASLRP
jgi:Ribbon-helix-helix protein, copG family